MTKRHWRRVNTLRHRVLQASKQNADVLPSSHQSVSSSCTICTSTPSTHTLEDCASDDEQTSTVHHHKMTADGGDVEVRSTRRSSARRRRGQYSWVMTLAGLVGVHAVLLVAYGVHSKWHWATELTHDLLAAVTLVLACLFQMIRPLS